MFMIAITDVDCGVHLTLLDGAGYSGGEWRVARTAAHAILL